MRSHRFLPALAAVTLLACETQSTRPSAPPPPGPTVSPVAPEARASTPAAASSSAAAPIAEATSTALVDTCPAGMVGITGGSYTTPARRDLVTVTPFCMDRTEVAVDAYAACVKAGKCSDAHVDGWTSDGASFVAEDNCNYGKPGRARQPMNCVDWKQATAFCAAQGARLPTEEEWEWVARGGARGSRYPWGDAVPDAQVCWSLKGQPQRRATCAVGTSAADASPLGVLDLAGSVSEWTATPYNDEHARVVRGATFTSQFEYHGRASTRGGVSPVAHSVATGFRCTVGRR